MFNISSKTEHFSYKGGCGVHEHCRDLEEELAWATGI